MNTNNVSLNLDTIHVFTAVTAFSKKTFFFVFFFVFFCYSTSEMFEVINLLVDWYLVACYPG